MASSADLSHSLAEQILEKIHAVVQDADLNTRPLELDPYRSQLFELFVAAEGAGYLRAGAEPDLTADGLCRALAERWGLSEAARASAERQSKLPPSHVAQMRLLWSLMRMWMEWAYAWERWPEFHRDPSAT